MISFDEACKRTVMFENRIDGGLEAAERMLAHYGYGDSTYGIKHIECAGRSLSYLNSGDAYSLTIAQESCGELFVTSWGDWVEKVEEEYCEENNVIRCGYCGEFTDCAEDWEKTVCDHCEHLASGG